MQVSVNGEAVELSEKSTVSDLLHQLELAPESVAVECNREVVPRAKHSEVILQPGDALELVHFVGGG